MLAGCTNGLVQLYDLRQSQKAAASVQPHRTSMVTDLCCLSAVSVVAKGKFVKAFLPKHMLQTRALHIEFSGSVNVIMYWHLQQAESSLLHYSMSHDRQCRYSSMEFS